MLRRNPLLVSDQIWREDGERNGWVLPSVSWPFRLPGVRLVRFFWHSWKLESHVRTANELGLGVFADPRDKWVLWAIRRGWA